MWTVFSASELYPARLKPVNHVKTVTSQSATILGKKRIYLNADHSGLNKFRDEQDDNFQLFLPELKTIVSNAVKHHSHSRH